MLLLEELQDNQQFQYLKLNLWNTVDHEKVTHRKQMNVWLCCLLQDVWLLFTQWTSDLHLLRQRDAGDDGD